MRPLAAKSVAKNAADAAMCAYELKAVETDKAFEMAAKAVDAAGQAAGCADAAMDAAKAAADAADPDYAHRTGPAWYHHDKELSACKEAMLIDGLIRPRLACQLDDSYNIGLIDYLASEQPRRMEILATASHALRDWGAGLRLSMADKQALRMVKRLARNFTFIGVPTTTFTLLMAVSLSNCNDEDDVLYWMPALIEDYYCI
ncbi:hypothetical protein H4R26_001478 [Coemansia thaxteri]|uniref:Uncharacterized protein n=1 Tax=Coemansia thaxteri TaxID=2663907 RepID=A0A9W8EL49_9FUNG|nr:hypothetical protein H4R26_001478 [Coemansia thaxteri]